MAITLTPTRQRVPMINAATLEGRTRPALDGSAASRLRYFNWPTWAAAPDHGPDTHQPRPTQARLGRR